MFNVDLETRESLDQVTHQQQRK